MENLSHESLPFVGRSKEIAQLIEILENTKNGSGSITFITGAVGIGKTRLLEIAENYAIAEEFTVLKGRGLDENSVPFLPFRDAMKNIDTASGESILPIGLSVVNEELETEAIDINRERYRVYEKFHAKLKALMEKKPLLIIIDDVHWADRESLNLLAYLARFVSQERFSIFCAYPDDYLTLKKSKHLQEIIEKLVINRWVCSLRLGHLKIEDAGVLLEALLQTWKIPDELLRVIYEKTEGNPLYIEEMAHVVLTQGFYDPRSRRIKRVLSELTIPQNIATLVKSRIELLPENAKKLLGCAAILGRRFRYPHIQRLSELPEEELISALELLVGSGYIVEEKGMPDTYRFSHNIFYEVSYGMQTGLRRKIFHEKAAKIFEETERESEEGRIAIATHYWLACNYEKCAYASIQVARELLGKYAVEDAIKYAKMANDCMQLCKINDATLMIDARMLMADGKMLLSLWEDAIGDLIEGRNIARANNEEKTEVKILLKLAFAEQKRGNPEAAIYILTEALEIARNRELHQDVGRIYRMLGFIYEKRGDYTVAETYYLKSMEISDKYSDEIESAEVYHRYGTNLMMRGRTEEAKEYLQKSAELRKKHNLLTALANTYNNLGALYATIGKPQEAIGYYVMAKEIFEKTHDISGQAFIYNNLGVIYHDAGNWERAMEFYRKDYETNTKLGNKWDYLVSASNIANLYKDMGDFEKAKEFYSISLKVSAELGEKRISTKVLANLGVVYANEGNMESAKNYLDNALSNAEHLHAPEVSGAVYLNYGIFARITKKYEEADSYFKKALEIYQQMGANGDIAATQLEMGILEKERGNMQKAKELLATALAYFEKTGVRKAVERIKKELEQIQ
ncbi:MAG: BREX system ATP-binding domain-containing protein [Thermoplasmata archaeon]